MTWTHRAPVPPADRPEHRVVHPEVLYLGTPVVLLTTRDEQGDVNLAPFSSVWAMGDTLVLGVGTRSRTAQNLLAGSDLVVNVPGPGLWRQVEALARTTACDPVPAGKPAGFVTVRDKFARAGLTAVPADLVAAPRVAECVAHLESRVTGMSPEGVDFWVVRAQVLRVHAGREVLDDTGERIDPARWAPLLYAFRHYRPLGPSLGATVRASAG